LERRPAADRVFEPWGGFTVGLFQNDACARAKNYMHYHDCIFFELFNHHASAIIFSSVQALRFRLSSTHMLKLRMPRSWMQPGSVVINAAAHTSLCRGYLQVPGVRYVPKIGTQRQAYAESHAHNHLISREILKSQCPSISLKVSSLALVYNVRCRLQI
jgi:hypothetical protein